jgi:hypothetical protein
MTCTAAAILLPFRCYLCHPRFRRRNQNASEKFIDARSVGCIAFPKTWKPGREERKAQGADFADHWTGENHRIVARPVQAKSLMLELQLPDQLL